MEKKAQDLSIGYFVAALALMFLAQYFLFAKAVEPLSYSQFKTLLKHGQVTDIVVRDKDISGVVKPEAIKKVFTAEKVKELGDRAEKPVPFVAIRVEDPRLASRPEDQACASGGSRLDRGENAGVCRRGFSELVNEAALLAARQGKDAVEMTDFDEAIERVVAGLQKKSRVMSPKEKKIVAYHESGHALVAELVPGTDPVSKISIIPRGMAALGYTQQTPTEDRYLMTRSELLARIYVLLGGRVAEEMVFDDVSTGAQNDLQRATEIARTMVTQFGTSDKLGLVSFEGPRTPLFLPIPVQTAKEYSEDSARLIDAEVKPILTEAHEKVKGTLATHRAALEELAQLLLKKEVVERAELQAILKVVSIEQVREKKKAGDVMEPGSGQSVKT